MERTETKASLGQKASSEFQGGGVLLFAERLKSAARYSASAAFVLFGPYDADQSTSSISPGRHVLSNQGSNGP
jgi:hypothetical protein